MDITTLFPEINRRVLTGQPLKEVLHFICTRSAPLFESTFVWIGRKEKDGSISIQASGGEAAAYGQHLGRIGIRWDSDPLSGGPAGQVIQSGVSSSMKVRDPGFAPWSDEALNSNLHAVLSIPLVFDNRIWGSYSIYSCREEEFDSTETVQKAEAIGERICLAIERTLDQQRIRALSAALEKAADAVFITNPAGEVQWANEAFTRQSGYTMEELLGSSPRILKSADDESRYYRRLWKTIQGGDIWHGETIEHNRHGERYIIQQTITPVRDDSGDMVYFVGIHQDITERKATEDRIRRLAHYDTLTGVPNRTLFYDRLDQAIALGERNDRTFALLYLDLDGFKPVNDLHGHQCGDAILKIAARRIARHIRSSDTVARIGGDEFAVILHDLRDERSATSVAENIVEAISAPMSTGGQDIEIDVSIGIAIYPAAGRSGDAIVHAADQAMYAAKRSGKKVTVTVAPGTGSEESI